MRRGMTPTNCLECGHEFAEGEYEFGDIDAPVCSECWYAVLYADLPAKSLFGIVAGLTDMEEFED